MKAQQNKKPRIVIPQLIKNMKSKHEYDSDKQNVCTSNVHYQRSRSFVNNLMNEGKRRSNNKQNITINLYKNINVHRKKISYGNAQQPLNLIQLKSKVKISNFLDQSSQEYVHNNSQSDYYQSNSLYSSNMNNKVGNEESKILQGKTTQSTDRTLQPNSEPSHNRSDKQQQQIVEESRLIQRVNCKAGIINGCVIKNKDLQKLSTLLKNDRMFVNPDKWNEYLERAFKDQQFCKALNVFLYSYFIQHYN